MVTLSILGQPPSEDFMELRHDNNSRSDDLRSGLTQLMKNQGMEMNDGKASYQDIIMNEQLDEKEVMFMKGTVYTVSLHISHSPN